MLEWAEVGRSKLNQISQRQVTGNYHERLLQLLPSNYRLAHRIQLSTHQLVAAFFRKFPSPDFVVLLETDVSDVRQKVLLQQLAIEASDVYVRHWEQIQIRIVEVKKVRRKLFHRIQVIKGY